MWDNVRKRAQFIRLHNHVISVQTSPIVSFEQQQHHHRTLSTAPNNEAAENSQASQLWSSISAMKLTVPKRALSRARTEIWKELIELKQLYLFNDF